MKRIGGAKGMRRESTAPRVKPGRLAMYAALIVVAALFFIVPIWIVVVGSWKPFGEAIEFSLALPREWALVENYSEVVDKARYVASFFNSLLVTSASVAALLLIGSLAAWAFWPIPVAVDGDPLLRDDHRHPAAACDRPDGLPDDRLHIDGSYVAVILYTIGVRMAVVVFLMTGFVRGLPREIEEAAEVDGASVIATYYHVVLPLLRPILLTAFVILVITIWNDFLGPFFLLHGPERWTLPLSLYNLANSASSGRQIPWNLVFAQLVLVSGPLLVVYFLAQRKIVAGLTSGAIKG